MSYGANIPTLAGLESSTVLTTIVSSVLNFTELTLVEIPELENSTVLPPIVSTTSFVGPTLNMDEPKLSVNTIRYVQLLYSIFYVRTYIIYIFTCDDEFKISMFSSEKAGLSYANLLDLLPLVILSVTLLILFLMIFVCFYHCAGNLYSSKLITLSNLWL
jgi:hypothetical protein